MTKNNKPTVVIVGVTQELIIDVVIPARNLKLCHFLLFGTENFDMSRLPDIDYRQFKTDEEVMAAAIYDISRGYAQILMKGIIPTAKVLHAVLAKENQLTLPGLLSQVTVFDVQQYDLPRILTDPALNIAPTVEQKIEITKNAVQVAHDIGIRQPRVGILSSVEAINPKMPSAVDAANVAKYFQTHPIKAIVEGPISFDVATVPQAAEIKHYPGKIKGNADVLVVPTIDVGNVLYKVFTHFLNFTSSGILVGAKIPIVLTSRSDSSQTKVASLQLAIKTLEVNQRIEVK